MDVRNNLQTFHTIAEVNMASPFGAGQDPGGSVGAKFPCKSKPTSIFPSFTQSVIKCFCGVRIELAFKIGMFVLPQAY